MNSNNFFLSLLIACTSILNVLAQNSLDFQIEPIRKLSLSEFSESWHPALYSIERTFPGSDSYRNYLHQLKLLRFSQGSQQAIPAYSTKKTSALDPIYSSGFVANPFGGIPNDNDLAISNDGFIVSVCNSDMYVYDEQGNALFDLALEDLADSLGLVANSYDPKVIYDQDEDRFILVFLNGNNSNSTDIVVCFSETNDPQGAWNVYSLPGNPLNNNAWSDFPMIAINQNDFFVTVNHINSDSASWQTGFMQSVVWQVEKATGYDGGILNSKVHVNINYNSRPIRNLLPIKGGMELAQDKMYFLSNRNFDFSNDTFFVVEITEALSANPNLGTTSTAVLSNKDYGLPPDAKQTLTTFLQTNDARPLSGFMENGQIHFVGNTVDESGSLAAIYHGKLNTLENPWSVDLEILSDPVLEYGYPNISFTGQTRYDEQAIISFNHTSIDSFPGVSAIFYSLIDGYSDRMHLISGTSVVDVITGEYERWGDYSGSQRRYNEAGTVWINGFMGFRNNLSLNIKNQHRTFIAKLVSPDSLRTSLPLQIEESFSLYPNPMEASFDLKFFNPKTSMVKFNLYNSNGELIDLILEAKVKEGENAFSFSASQLASGVYFLVLQDEHSQTILQEKLVKQ